MIMEGLGVFLYRFWKSHPRPWNEARCHLRSLSGCSKGQGGFVPDVFGGSLLSWFSVCGFVDKWFLPCSTAQTLLGSRMGYWEHKACAEMGAETWVYISYIHSCGKPVLLDSVPLRVKIEMWVEFVVYLWIYIFLSEATLLFLAVLVWRG